MSLHPVRVSALELSPPPPPPPPVPSPRSHQMNRKVDQELPVLGWRVPSAQEANKMAGWGQQAGDCLLVEIFSLRHNLTYLQAQGTL